jgi:hypothetical protein
MGVISTGGSSPQSYLRTAIAATCCHSSPSISRSWTRAVAVTCDASIRP